MKENAVKVRVKTVDMAARAFVEAGKRAKSSITKSRLSTIPSKVRLLTAELHEHLAVTESQRPGSSNTVSSLNSLDSLKKENMMTTGRTNSNNNDLDSTQKGRKTPIRHKKKKKTRPKSAPNSQFTNGESDLLNLSRSTRFDHRKNLFSRPTRPRTPGSIAYTINEDGKFTKEDIADWFTDSTNK